MECTKDDVMQYVESEDVKFIRLAFCGPQGDQKNIAVMPGALEQAFHGGIPIDAGSVPGLGSGQVFLRPDPATLLQMPWRPQHGRVVHMFCDLLAQDGSPWPQDHRAKLKAMPSPLTVYAESPFTLYKLDEQGRPTAEPYDEAGYLDIAPADRGENIRRAICLTLEQMGIQPESSHHGAAPGENLICYRRAGLLQAADDMVTFRAVVRTMADQSGLFAEFAKPPRLSVQERGTQWEFTPKDGWQNPYKLMAAVGGGHDI